MSPTTMRSSVPDQICADAADLARQAVEEVAGAAKVGEHLGVVADGDRVASHLFACQDDAYAGWRWEVTVARAARAKSVTICESQLLPGPDSLVAPPWVPWSERVRPGDLGAGDLMPASSDDERLVPVVAIDGADGLLDWDDSRAWALSPESEDASQDGAPAQDAAPAAGERALAAGGDALAAGQDAEPSAKGPATVLGPARVLSAIGRESAASRWYESRGGSAAARANAAPGPCLTCGFLVRLSGQLGQLFGVCANEFAPDDGRVVAVDYGCGAHSDPALPAGTSYRPASPAVDELGYDITVPPGAVVPDIEEMGTREPERP